MNSQQQRIETVVDGTVSDHCDFFNHLLIGKKNVAIEIDGVETRDDHDNHHQELPSLCKRHLVTSVQDEVHPRKSLAAYMELVDAAQRIRAAFRAQTEKEIKEFKFFNQDNESRKRVAAIKIQHAFHKYKARKMADAATRIQRTFRAKKIRKNQQTVKFVFSQKSQLCNSE
ncbi:calmodulin-binding transcription activator 6-like [Vicia villosa]|uniref:calmodulin-binding transcription activator 6-like n=1 Tax=Vicia villosa TaxID=3911 RepID=UPI00273A84A6|nr:calmodulin-binding transcription activator 6-like [Vicia villosa]